ncbi:uncharacterized protein LACBIDRAFT_314305 [Laccaria bicolor S238N-H82]|uniref:Predicted protein n=1 Tax=Laccaria bicolor (strain S238N-H82 / ATCC MYA-4686) TaxID=486041 RepID=B0DY91_LACBS|nr:uncharacterized protein LACBIDRAFT_314305 [Laccaria bicolor S238N-H82]EDR00392.1 predicted protein [Laccaria bicolor S238N-H82]|eukprot:XP_001888951.1 predicted protein [Laccaria bicolor S238N-H82]
MDTERVFATTARGSSEAETLPAILGIEMTGTIRPSNNANTATNVSIDTHDEDRGMARESVSDGSVSLTSMWSDGQALRGRSTHHGADPERPNISVKSNFIYPTTSDTASRSRANSPVPERFASVNTFRLLPQIPTSWAHFYQWSSPIGAVDSETNDNPGQDAIAGPTTNTNPSFNSSSNGFYNRNEITVKSLCEATRLLPRQIYYNLLLLRFPMWYHSRTAGSDSDLDSLSKDWEMVNGVSAFLISAILTLLQIPQASNDPITKNTAQLSLICALMGLVYGYIYMVRFGTMRSIFRSSKWEEEVRGTSSATWWNVQVLLAMPAVSTSWSMLLFLASIISFVWLDGSVNDSSPPLNATAGLGPRVAVTGVLVIGMVYFAMIMKTLARYDRELREMSADVEMSSGAFPVQNGEPEGRNREVEEEQ